MTPSADAELEKATASPLLQAAGLSKHFGGVQAVQDVSLTIDRGELLGLIGPNGSGKSTLLDLIAGIQTADQGSVALGSDELTWLSSAERARRGMSRLFQQSRVYKSLTVEENVRVVVGQHGSADEKTVAEALEIVGLAAHRIKLAGELSYGQQRLLDIARALAMQPSVLLLDEPTAGVHVRLIDGIAALLQRLVADTRIGVLVIEHNVAFVRSVCTRLMAMDAGVVIASGAVDQVLIDDAVVKAYYGG
jgi:branched-chain amino acid transport system permease protein